MADRVNHRLVGQRIGAILDATAERVNLLGYGVYEGDFEVPDLPVPEKNPRLRLDDGRIIWGYECWWGEEKGLREWIGDRTVIPALLERERPPTPKDEEFET